MANRKLKQRKMNDSERLAANRKRNRRRQGERKFRKGWKAYIVEALKVMLIWNRMTKRQRRQVKVEAGLRPAKNMYGGTVYVQTEEKLRAVSREGRRRLLASIAGFMGQKGGKDGH